MPITLVYNSDLTSSTSTTWTVPNGVSSVTFEVWGGGGGGAATAWTCNCVARAMSGGGGGYSMKTITVTPGAVYTLCAGNGGCTSSGTGWGSEASACASGYNGNPSWVTGTNLSNFCASGGQGGQLSAGDGNYHCYRSCGCNSPLGGMGYGGDVMECGGMAVQGTSYSAGEGWGAFTMGGQGAGPGGGVGGFNIGGWGNLNSCGGSVSAASGNNPYLWGVFPGGGGAGAGFGCCACSAQPGGRGAGGLVKITW